jgi:hypothetical protein
MKITLIILLLILTSKFDVKAITAENAKVISERNEKYIYAIIHKPFATMEKNKTPLTLRLHFGEGILDIDTKYNNNIEIFNDLYKAGYKYVEHMGNQDQNKVFLFEKINE